MGRARLTASASAYNVTKRAKRNTWRAGMDAKERARLLRLADRFEKKAIQLRAEANSAVCPFCGKEFMRGPGAGRRIDSVYCSTECQKKSCDAAYRERYRAVKSKASR